MRRDWAKANADTLVHYLQAYIEGLRWALDPANKTEAIKLLADGLKLPPDVAERTYAIATDPAEGLAKDARFDVAGFENVLALRASFEGGTPARQTNTSTFPITTARSPAYDGGRKIRCSQAPVRTILATMTRHRQPRTRPSTHPHAVDRR